MEGILYALVPMFAWGLIGFVSNKIGGSANQQTLGMTFGAFIFSLGVFLIKQPTLTWPIILLGFAGGFLWSIGQNGQFHAMKYMGVSVAGPLSSGSQLVLGGLLGALIFGEWSTSLQYILGFIAFAILIIGFYFSAKRDPENQTQDTQLRNFSKGFRAVTYSTIGYVAYTILFNNLSSLVFGIDVDTLTIIFPMSIGMIFGTYAFSGFKIKLEPVVFKNILVGLMWGVGNVFMLLAADKAGLAIAFSFSQLGIIVSTIGSILFLGEKKTKKELGYVAIGTVLFVVGALLLAVVKSQ
jgi:glucose uptake protein